MSTLLLPITEVRQNRKQSVYLYTEYGFDSSAWSALLLTDFFFHNEHISLIMVSFLVHLDKRFH